MRPGAAAAPTVFLTARSGADAQGYCPLNNLALSGARPAQLDKGWLDLPLPWFPLWTGWMCQACVCVVVPSDSRCPGRCWVCSPPTAYVEWGAMVARMEPPWLFLGGRGLGGHSSPRGVFWVQILKAEPAGLAGELAVDQEVSTCQGWSTEGDGPVLPSE